MAKTLNALGRRAREVALLTALSAWRGFLGFYNSDDLTYAASIAYYALLSLFPFFLLAFALLGRATADAADHIGKGLLAGPRTDDIDCVGLQQFGRNSTGM